MCPQVLLWISRSQFKCRLHLEILLRSKLNCEGLVTPPATHSLLLFTLWGLFQWTRRKVFRMNGKTWVGMNGSPWISWCSRPNGLHISCQNLELDPNNFSASSSQGWQCWHHISSAEQRENVSNILIVVVQVFDQLPNKTEVAKITQSE